MTKRKLDDCFLNKHTHIKTHTQFLNQDLNYVYLYVTPVHASTQTESNSDAQTHFLPLAPGLKPSPPQDV